jgi:hypothetical protein
VGEEAVTTTARQIKLTDAKVKSAAQSSGSGSRSGSKYKKGIRTDYTDEIPEAVPFDNEVRGTATDGLTSGKKSAQTATQRESDVTTSTTKFIPVEEMQSFEAGLKGFVDADLPEKASGVINDVYGLLSLAGVADPRKTSASIARKVLRATQELGAENKVYKGREVTVKFKQEVKNLAGRMNASLRNAVDGSTPLDPQTNLPYSKLMDKITERLDDLDTWQQAAGVWEYDTALDAAGNVITLQSKRNLDELAGNKKMVSTMRSLFGDSHQTLERMIQQLEHTWGVDVRESFNRAALSERIGLKGAHGKMGLFPQLATGGGVKLGGAFGSLGLAGGLGAYAATGDPIIGGLAGLASAAIPAVMSSPRFIVGAGKALRGVGTAGLESALESGKATSALYATMMELNKRKLTGGETANMQEQP